MRRGKTFLVGCCMALALAGHAFSQVVYQCFKTPVPIVVDGIANDSAWTKSTVKEAPLAMSPADKEIVQNRKVFFKSVWDNNYLYFYCWADNPYLWNLKTGRDVKGMYDENAFEWFFSPNTDNTGNGVNYIEIQANIDGNLSDLVNYAKEDGNYSYNIEGLKAATKQIGTYCKDTSLTVACNADTDTGWSIELAIPFTAFKVDSVLSRSDELKTRLIKGEERYTFTSANVRSWDSLLVMIKSGQNTLALNLLSARLGASVFDAIKALPNAGALTEQQKTQVVNAFVAMQNDMTLFSANAANIAFVDTMVRPDTIPPYPLDQPGVSTRRVNVIDTLDTLGRDTLRTGRIVVLFDTTYTDTIIYTAPTLPWDCYVHLIGNSTFPIDSTTRIPGLKATLTQKDSIAISWFNFILLQEMLFPRALVKNVWTKIDILGQRAYPPEATTTQSWKANVYMVTSPLDSMYRINYIWANAASIQNKFHQVPNFGNFILSQTVLPIAVVNPLGARNARTGLTVSAQGPNAVEISYMVPLVAKEVRLEVFSPDGTLLKSLPASREAGAHRTTLDTSRLPSGAYLFRLSTDGRTAFRRMTLVK